MRRSPLIMSESVDPLALTARLLSAAEQGVDPSTVTRWLELLVTASSGLRDGRRPGPVPVLAEYGDEVIAVAFAGLESTTLDPYLAGWRKRIRPALGHLPLTEINAGVIDRAILGWIADGHKRSTLKNTLAALTRILAQAVRDTWLVDVPGRMPGWQRAYQQAQDELDDPRELALPDYRALLDLAEALVDASHDHYPGWGEAVIFNACTGVRIGEVSGVRACDIDPVKWVWTVRRQTTPAPGGLIDKHTKGRHARKVPIIEPLRPLVAERLAATRHNPTARLFTGPRGGRIATAVLRDATHWTEVTTHLGYEHLRRHDLRHTGLTWMADAGIPLHVLTQIAGHTDSATTQRYLHPDIRHIIAAGKTLTHYLTGRDHRIPSHW